MSEKTEPLSYTHKGKEILMIKCYHCGQILSHAWLKKQGASLMGKTGGETKRRSREVYRAAALARWDREKLTREIAAELAEQFDDANPAQ